MQGPIQEALKDQTFNVNWKNSKAQNLLQIISYHSTAASNYGHDDNEELYRCALLFYNHPRFNINVLGDMVLKIGISNDSPELVRGILDKGFNINTACQGIGAGKFEWSRDASFFGTLLCHLHSISRRFRMDTVFSNQELKTFLNAIDVFATIVHFLNSNTAGNNKIILDYLETFCTTQLQKNNVAKIAVCNIIELARNNPGAVLNIPPVVRANVAAIYSPDIEHPMTPEELNNLFLICLEERSR